MAGSPRSNNQWRLKHARHSAVGGRARGDSDRTGGRRRVRGARAGARTSDLHDLKRGRPKRWPARLPSDRRRPAGGQEAPSSEVDALPGEPRPRRPRRGTSDRPRLADHDRDRARTSRWDRWAHRVSETIYQGIYARGARGLVAGLGGCLHRKARRRRPRARAGEVPKAAGPLGQFNLIGLRGEIAALRSEVGQEKATSSSAKAAAQRS